MRDPGSIARLGALVALVGSAACSALVACTGTTVDHQAVPQAPTVEHFSISSIDTRYATGLSQEEEAIAAEYEVGERLAEKIQGWATETGMWGGVQSLAIEVDSLLLRKRFATEGLEEWAANTPRPVQDRLGIQVEIRQGERGVAGRLRVDTDRLRRGDHPHRPSRRRAARDRHRFETRPAQLRPDAQGSSDERVQLGRSGRRVLRRVTLEAELDAVVAVGSGHVQEMQAASRRGGKAQVADETPAQGTWWPGTVAAEPDGLHEVHCENDLENANRLVKRVEHSIGDVEAASDVVPGIVEVAFCERSKGIAGGHPFALRFFAAARFFTRAIASSPSTSSPRSAWSIPA